MRKNVDIAQMWAFSDSEDDQSYLRWYAAPPSDHYEAVSNVDETGNVSKDIADRGIDLDLAIDELSPTEALPCSMLSETSPEVYEGRGPIEHEKPLLPNCLARPLRS